MRKIILLFLLIVIIQVVAQVGVRKIIYSRPTISTHFMTPVTSDSGSMTIGEVTLDYQLVPPGSSGKSNTYSFDSLAYKYAGVYSTSNLPALILQHDPDNRNTKCVLDTSPIEHSRGGFRVYKIRLSYPPGAESLELANAVGERLGFKVYSLDTEIPRYRAVRNNIPMVFDINSTANNDSAHISISQATCTFYNAGMQDIFNQFEYWGKIDDASGVQDKFNGQISLSPNPIDIKNELATKLGVHLIPYPKKVKYYKVTKQSLIDWKLTIKCILFIVIIISVLIGGFKMGYQSTKRIPIIIVTIVILATGFYWGYQASKAKKSLPEPSSAKTIPVEQTPRFDQSTTLLVSVNTTTLLFAIDSIQTSLSVKPSIQNKELPAVIDLQLYLIESSKTFMIPRVSSLADQSFTMDMIQVIPGKGKSGKGISGTAHVVSDEQIELKVRYYVY